MKVNLIYKIEILALVPYNFATEYEIVPTETDQPERNHQIYAPKTERQGPAAIREETGHVKQPLSERSKRSTPG